MQIYENILTPQLHFSISTTQI
jgi:hypothetical protein